MGACGPLGLRLEDPQQMEQPPPVFRGLRAMGGWIIVDCNEDDLEYHTKIHNNRNLMMDIRKFPTEVNRRIGSNMLQTLWWWLLGYFN